MRPSKTAIAIVMVLSRFTVAEPVVVDNVRVQFLSPTLIRLEEKGPRGFEDRATFHITGRDFDGAPDVSSEETVDGITVRTDSLQVFIKRPANSITGIEIKDRLGRRLYRCEGDEANSRWLPGPGNMPAAWSFADRPRIVPPPWGALPPPGGQAENHPDTSGWDISNDAVDVYVFMPDDNYEVLRRDFLMLTGHAPLPPLYAFGAWDSRYHPYSEETALAQIDGYRSRQIPLDVFVVDTDWRIGASHGYGINSELFPDMRRFVRAAAGRSVRLMYNDHPEPVAGTALAPDELSYRHDGLGSLLAMGIDIWWYDRNWMTHLHEPAPGIRKEVWGMQLYSDITRSHRPDLRPMIMANVDGIDNGRRNRPPNVASHRFPIQWTGDTQCHTRFLAAGVENALYSGVHALNAYISEDLGGHVGRPDPRTYVRWVQFGAMSPIFRLHCTRGDVRSPWEFGEVAESISREYVQMRYRLLPVIYGAARRNHESGEPILRRLDLEWPKFEEARRNDQYLFGRQILVAPICQDQSKTVPAGWLKTRGERSGLTAEYFANPELEGAPVLTRIDSDINFRWTGLEPAPGLGSENYSVRWTGKLGPVPGDAPLRLRVAADDGARVFLNGQAVIDEWQPQSETTFTARKQMIPGEVYELRVEFQQLRYDSVCRLSYIPDDVNTRDERTVWIPPGSWLNLWTGDITDGPVERTVSAELRRMPMFVRRGGIITLAPALQHVEQRKWSPLTIDVYPADAGVEEFLLYEDDGRSNDYLDGEFRTTRVDVVSVASEKSVRVGIGPAVGTFRGSLSARSWRVRVHVPREWVSLSVHTVRINAAVVSDWLLIEPDSGAMPFALEGGSPDGRVVQIDLPDANVSHPVSVQFLFN